MSASRDPHGPQPGRVYWRRRIIVGLGVLAVIAVILLIVFRPADQPAPAASDSPAAPAAPSEGNPAEQPAAPSGPTVCTGDQVQIDAVTDLDTYDPGVAPQLSWTLSNSSGAPCTIDVGTSQQVFTITSGDDVIWTSSDCQSDSTEYLLTVEPGAAPTSSASIPWDRTRSSADTCDGEREQVIAGGASYHLEVTVGGVSSSDSRQFILN